MKWRGGGGGTDGSGGGYPVACSEVRIVNAGGGIMECLTVQEACARGLIGGSVCTTTTTASTTQLDTSAQLAAGSALPQSIGMNNLGCLFCGGLLVLLIVADALFGTNLLIRRKR